MGDFNTDLLADSFDRQHLLDFINSSSLYVVPFDATHHTATSHTLIDLCIVDDQEKISTFHQEPVPFLSMHDLISITYKLHVSVEITTPKQVRDYRKFRESAFLHDLEAVNWSPFFDTASIDEKVCLLNDSLLSVFNVHAPLRVRRKPRPSANWLNEAVRQAIRTRNRLRKKFRNSNLPAHLDAFKKARNLVKRLSRDAKREYYTTYFSKLHTPAELWSKIRQLRLIKCRSEPLPLRVDLNELNEWYTCSSSQITVSEEPFVVSKGYDDNLFYFSDITPVMLLESLHCLRSNARGVDELTASMIKLSLPVTFPLFLHLFNFSLSHSCFPKLWKSALVRPVPKCGNPVTPADYRPISLLCAMSKPLERIVVKQFTAYLETKSLLDPFQSAYRRDFSTQTALIRITDDIRRAIDQRMLTVMVLFDFSKAFDRVVLSTLIDKLDRLELSTSVLSWFASYISGHVQAVLGDDGEVSAWAPLTTGVPQGSILGPLLFSIYVNDLRSVINCNYNFYADDLQIYAHCYPSDIENTISYLNQEISQVCEWASINGLSINPGKTRAIIFGSQRHINHLDFSLLPSIRVHAADIKFSESVVLLGIILTSTLKWKDQAIKVVKKVNKQLHLLKLNRDLLTFNLRRKLITSLIFPFVDYCCVVFTNITADANAILQRALNNCVRFVTGLRRSDHVSPAFSRLAWLKIDKRRLYFLLSLLHKLLLSQRPGYLYCSVKLTSPDRLHSTRSEKSQLFISNARTTTWQKSFTITAAVRWNELPASLREYNSTHSFKDALYRHLLAP